MIRATVSRRVACLTQGIGSMTIRPSSTIRLLPRPYALLVVSVLLLHSPLKPVRAQAGSTAGQDTASGMLGGYDGRNPFARILRGELPVSIVHEDAHVLAFIALNMRSLGHTLVISKQPARTLLDIAPDALARVMAVVQRVARVQHDVLGADGVQLVQNNGAAAGQTVFHLHVHVIPVFAGVPVQPPSVAAAPRVLMDSVARELAAGMRP